MSRHLKGWANSKNGRRTKGYFHNSPQAISKRLDEVRILGEH
jgi:hypothetical protein